MWPSCATPPHRFLVVFNPLEQERLSLVPLLVNSPHVRVLSENGQPLPAQLSAHWSSATDAVPDTYQVGGAPLPTVATGPCLAGSSTQVPSMELLAQGSCCPQLSILARLPALGLRVLQLQKSFDGHSTLQSSVRLYLHGRDMTVRQQEAVPVQVFPAAPDDFCLESQHLRSCFSGSSGLLQVGAGPKIERGWVPQCCLM